MAGYAAALFDLDGTLMDSEPLTDLAIRQVMAARGCPEASLLASETRGRSWRDISAILGERYAVSTLGLAQELSHCWISLDGDVLPVPGAAAAIKTAAQVLKLGVVSSSPRAVIDDFLERLGVAQLIPPGARVGAEDVLRGKPDPEPYLLGAKRLGVLPHQCVVFEDSPAGLRSAQAAGMARVLVCYACAQPMAWRGLADRSIQDYQGLDLLWWQNLARHG